MNFISPFLHPPIMLSLLLHVCVQLFISVSMNSLIFIISVKSIIGLELADGIFKLVPLPL